MQNNFGYYLALKIDHVLRLNANVKHLNIIKTKQLQITSKASTENTNKKVDKRVDTRLLILDLV